MFEIPILPRQASTMAGEVDALYWTWIAISAFFALLVAGLIFYFFTRYRRRHPDEVGQPERASTALEIIWSVIPLVIALTMFTWGTKVYFSLSRPPADAVEYYATGKQWMWKFQHPNGKREINNLHVPTGVPIKLTMISEDVIHSMYVPAFRIKADVLPGRYTTVWFEATEPGEYHLFCAEYCGTEHSLMGGTVTVMERADYQAWLAQETGPITAEMASGGEGLFASLACTTCHMAGERQRGPALEGIFGTSVQMADGSSVVVDESYIRESILNPQARLVAGYDPVMPTYQGQVTEEQLFELIDYIKTLGAEGGAEAAATEPAESTGEPATEPAEPAEAAEAAVTTASAATSAAPVDGPDDGTEAGGTER